MPAAPADAAHAFVAAINAADPAALRALMTEDHTFTDALGNRFSGAETIVQGWRYFLHAFPGYWIRIDRTIGDEGDVALFGAAGDGWRAGERVLPQSWKVAAAWFAQVESGRIRSWSVFCDTSWGKPPEESEKPR
jgi:ketosteroid isomerase-like protein